MVKLFFDPGHGGRDGGAVGNGLVEKDVCLKIALSVGGKITGDYEAELYYSRTTDVEVPLRERARMANNLNADLFVSFHSNGFADNIPNGYEDFILTSPTLRTIEIRDIFHNQVSAVWFKHKRSNRGKKRANFVVLRDADMPAILVENGFISNPEDAELLKDEMFLKELAEAHATGIAKALNLKKKSETDKIIEGKIYRVQASVFRNRSNAEKLVQDLKDKGFNATIREEELP